MILDVFNRSRRRPAEVANTCGLTDAERAILERRARRWWVPSRTFLAFVACGWMACSGCSRSFWRTQADFDGYNLLSQKQFDPRWVIPRTTVEPDNRSRFYDPYDRDVPPLPPDDPAASRYMQWVNGMHGYKSWHKFGRLMSVENPQWLEGFGIAPDTFHDSYRLSDGVTVGTDPAVLPGEEKTRIVPTIENLTLAQTIELASIHSRDYQTQLENLYLSALQLSLDQFQFQARYLFGRAPGAVSTALPGTTVPTGILNNSTIPGVSNTLGLSSAGGISQVLPTGGQWIIGLTNNTLWLFSSGGQHTTSQSFLSYSLVQPLLAGGGRKFFLENLTFSERNVLYNVRILSRYRRLFFADAVVNTAGGSVSSPSAISATSSASVVNPTVISTNQGVNVAAGTSAGTAPASVAGAPQGFFGMMFLLQQLLNQHDNVELLRIQAERLRELVGQMPYRRLVGVKLPDGVVFPQELANKVEYTPETQRLRWKDTNGMTERERDQLLAVSDDPVYQAAIREIYDQIRIGVTTLDYLQIANQLTQAEIQERQRQIAYDDEIDQFKMFIGVPTDMQMSIDRSLIKPFILTDPNLYAIEKRVLNFVSTAANVDETTVPIDDLRLIVEQLAQMVSLVGEHGVDAVADDLQKVDAIMPKRLQKLLWDESREIIAQRFERDKLIYANVREIYGAVGEEIESWRKQLNDPDLPLKDRQKILASLKDAREDLLQIIQSLRLLQTGLRSELLELIEFDMPLEEAVDTAMENRIDLMNLRGRVMDARRNMEVAANRLEAIVNLVGQGSLNTAPTGDHPLGFRGANSNFQFGVQMAAPLDQVQVRNVYRQSIVNYQQARRAYMLLEDQVKYDIRTSWRQLKLNAQNFETTRKALRQAALQLDINVANNLNPKQQVAGQAGTTNLGNTGINLLQALNQILTSQNNLIQFWLSYERNRINLYRDMDIMVVDERGLWDDPYYQNLDRQSLPLYPNEPAHDVPPEPSASGTDTGKPARIKRSIHPGIARIGSVTPASSEKAELDERDRRGRPGAGGRRRLAPAPIRVVVDHDSTDADSGPDGRSGAGDSQEDDVPDYGGREGNTRQYEERGPVK